jgi:ATP-dependent RNA helicase DDX18/HAS1
MDLPIIREQDKDKGTFFASSTFGGLGLSQDLQAALRTLGIKKPSHIQVSLLLHRCIRPLPACAQ